MATTTPTKTAITSATINANMSGATLATALANPAQNQGSAGSSQGKTNPPPGFEGATNLAGVKMPSTGSFAPATAADKQASLNQALGLVSKADAISSLAGPGSSTAAASAATSAVNAVLAGSNKTDKPATDQGFGSKPTSLGVDPVTGLNPMAAYQGQAIGGVLGAVAASDAKVPPASSGAAGSGLVSTDAVDAGLAIGTFAAAAQLALAAAKTAALAGEVLGAATPVGLALTAGVAIKATYDVASASAYGNADWFYNVVESSEDPTNPANQAHLDLEKVKAEAAKKAGGGAGMPNPENTGSNVNILTQTLLDQLNAAKTGKPASQGGSGDATPVDNGGIPQVVNNGSIAVNQGSINGRNLLGQPGGAALGENVSGGNKGLGGFTNSIGSGAINPGPDAGSPGGDPRFQQDPGAALGSNQPAPQFPPTGGSQDSQSSSVSTTLAAGIRNLTLTGTAAINGTGNALDNLITGNGAANELLGGSGNDTLDGGSGRDVLTGGSGADRFRFSSAGSFGTTQADRITDFSRSDGDRIEISRTAFGIPAGAAVSFEAVNSDADLIRALGSSTLLIQDIRDGSLLFNQNGATAGAGQGGIFALVGNGLTMQASDFSLLA